MQSAWIGMRVSLLFSALKAVERHLYNSSSKQSGLPASPSDKQLGSNRCSMYYHFCLLCVFRPFIGLTIEGSIIQPHEMCTQAVQSILALAQSYDDLFTVGRVSGFIPYFVCTSGLFSLAMQDRRSQTNLAHLRPGDAASIRVIAKPQEHEAAANPCGSLLLPAYVEISAATHAHLLLVKMGSTHPAARISEKLVLEKIECILGEEAAR